MASLREVVVDDTDNRIHYSGEGWFKELGSNEGLGNWGPRYLGTSHGTKSNSSLSFSFEGTSIALRGTRKLTKIDDTHWDPSWECFIDGNSIGATPMGELAENHWVLCESKQLSAGQHTLVVNIKSAGGTFWVDYIRFTPSSQVAFDTVVMYVDSTDPAIKFEPGSGWGLAGNAAFMTKVKGSSAQLDFIGKSVTWVGFKPKNGSRVQASGTFSVDGGTPISFKLDPLPKSGEESIFNQVLFTTPDLEAGPHKLIVTYDGPDQSATPLILHHLYVTNTSAPQSSSTTATVGSSTTINQHDLSSLSSSPSAVNSVLSTTATTLLSILISSDAQGPRSSTSISVSSPSNISSAQSQTPSKSTIVIIAVVVGVISTTLVVLIFIFCMRRRRRQLHRVTEAKTEQRVIPFTLFGTSALHFRGATFAKTKLSSPSSDPLLHSNNQLDVSDSSNPKAHTAGIDSTHAGDNHGGRAEVTQLTGPHHQDGEHAQLNIGSIPHQDSGLRFMAVHEDIIAKDVPPIYTAT